MRRDIDLSSLWTALALTFFVLYIVFCGCGCGTTILSRCEPKIVDPQHTHQGHGWWCYQAEAEEIGSWERTPLDAYACFRARAFCERKRAKTSSIDEFIKDKVKNYLIYSNCIWHQEAYCFSATAEAYWCGVDEQECNAIRGLVGNRAWYTGIDKCRSFE